MALPLALPLIAAAPQFVKGLGGLLGIGTGRRRARNNPFPTENVNQNYEKNVAIAENMARTGLPQEQYNSTFQNIGRNQATALNTLSRSANPTAGINSVLRASNDAVLGLGAQDANARLNNQRFAFGQRGQLAQEQNRVWDWNRRQRFLQNAQAAGQEIGAGKQNAMSALDGLSTIAQNYYATQDGQSSVPNSYPNVYNRMGKFGTLNYGTTNGVMA